MSLFRAISARIYAVVIFCQLTMMKCRERMIQGCCPGHVPVTRHGLRRRRSC